MVGQFLSAVGELLSAMLGIFDSVFALYLSGAIVSSFFALVDVYFDIFRGVTKW